MFILTHFKGLFFSFCFTEAVYLLQRTYSLWFFCFAIMPIFCSWLSWVFVKEQVLQAITFLRRNIYPVMSQLTGIHEALFSKELYSLPLVHPFIQGDRDWTTNDKWTTLKLKLYFKSKNYITRDCIYPFYLDILYFA